MCIWPRFRAAPTSARALSVAIPCCRCGAANCSAHCFGIDVDTLDDDGRPVSGQPGEFVCRNAHLSMPVKFWGDDGRIALSRSLFLPLSRIVGAWGLSSRNATAADISSMAGPTPRSILAAFGSGPRKSTDRSKLSTQIQEAIAVGQDIDGDQRVILFVKMREGASLDAALEKTIRSASVPAPVPRHVPGKDHCRRGHPAHALGQDFRDCGPRHDPWAGGQEHIGSGQSRKRWRSMPICNN